MIARRLLGVILLSMLGLAGAGCANEPLSGLRAASWAPIGNLGAASLTAMPTTDDDESGQVSPAAPARKTLGSKVLSAMALERATGRKPDPSRLNELD